MRNALLIRLILLILALSPLSLNRFTVAELQGNELAADPRALATRATPVIGVDEVIQTGAVAFGHSRWDYTFDHWELGNSWYDYQHNSTQGKQIVVSEDGVIHVCWMKGYDSGATERHAVYVCIIDDTLYGPVNVDNTARSGYCTLDVLDALHDHANAAVVAFHQQPGPDLGTTISADWGSCWLAFIPFNHTTDADDPIWPKIAIDNSNKVHLLSIRQSAGTSCDDATTDRATWETPTWIEIPTSSASLSGTVVTSEFDDQVALLTHDHLPLHPNEEGLIFSQANNDVWAHISPDGDFTDWEQVSSINVTDLLDSTTTEHPLPGHVYGYCDIDGLFDTDGNLHVAYTTRPYWGDYTRIDGEVVDSTYIERWAKTGQVWHAMIAALDEEIEFSHIAGYVGHNNEDDPEFASYFDGNPGGWGSLNDRPSLAIDPVNNTLYCMWRNFTNLPDTSVTGYSNAELWVRSSCDYGATWGEAVNITDSSTPGCLAGECASEAWGTLAEIVFDGYLHLECLEDLDAGGIVQEEGIWTNNPVWYLRVPVDTVPCGDAWDAGPHATRLTDTAWNWGALEDGTYEIIDYIHLLNEGSSTLHIGGIELIYHNGNVPEVTVTSVNGNSEAADIPPYSVAHLRYTWNAVIDDQQYDAYIRFITDGGTVDYKLSNRNSFSPEDVRVATDTTPSGLELAQNYPNPFNPTTTIEYTLTVPGMVTLEVFNPLGELVTRLVDGSRPAGTHLVAFDADELASGVYLYRLTTDSGAISRKMVLVR
ncbi:T9SS type A sorting domain-containing protein [bacterium]|nr:T9SS type A sorting domain-containing protein [bacterium]